MRGFSGDSLPWWECRHGWDIFYGQDGHVEAKSKWRDGKPWSGRCWIMAAGDAGSWGWAGDYHMYENGLRIE
jgi:hypothetical protein